MARSHGSIKQFQNVRRAAHRSRKHAPCGQIAELFYESSVDAREERRILHLHLLVRESDNIRRDRLTRGAADVQRRVPRIRSGLATDPRPKRDRARQQASIAENRVAKTASDQRKKNSMMRLR
jgi:hypothetical protein